jgi:hypothetical protein
MTTEEKDLIVIGAGWGRTGTHSLYEALTMLGFKTYHMVENFKNQDVAFWTKKFKDPNSVGIHEVLGKKGYDATVDWPAAPFYEEMMERYPNGKVILTLRDPEKCKRC